MATDAPGLAVQTLLQVEARTVLGGPAGDDTIPAAGGASLPAIFPAFLVPPADAAPPPDSVAGSLTFADPQAFVLSEPIGAGLPSAARLPAAGQGSAITMVDHSLPAGAVTAVLQDGTTLSFADFVAAPHGG
jgi:hypothetical protein